MFLTIYIYAMTDSLRSGLIQVYVTRDPSNGVLQVFLEFSNSEYYDESMKELDGVLSELTSKASFPQVVVSFCNLLFI